MVVGNFLVIKYFLGFRQGTCSFLSVGFQAQERRNGREIILNSRQSSRHFRIQVIAQIGCIHAFFIQGLNELKCLLRRKTEFLIAIDLQRGQVIQFGSELQPFLLLHRSDRQRQIFDTIHQSLSLFLGSNGIIILLHRQLGAEERIAVERFEFPIGARHEMLYLRLTLNHQRQGRRLHTPYGQHLSLAPAPARVPYCICTRSVHT